jgi:glycosyltransferase involved in cell wall biosynthesis
MQLPPPFHGVSQSNINVVNSKLINSSFQIQTIDLQFAESITELEHFSFKKVFKALKYCFVISKKAISFKPDLVYFTISPTGIAFYRDAFYVFILKLLRLKIVFHLHGQGFKETTRKNRFKLIVCKEVFKNNEVICLAKKLTKDIEDVFFSQPFIVPNGIQIRQESLSNSLVKNNETVQILYLSHYKENKGVLILIDALAILKKQGYCFHTRLVGEPASLSIDDLKKYIKISKIEQNIEVVGPLYDREKYSEFRKADIFVFPTYFDAFPLVNLEAMQFTLPIITTDEGGISEVVINGETGFVIEPRNTHQLVDKLTLLINNKDLRAEMGRKGKDRFFQYFTLQHFEHNLKNVFDTILKTG